MNIEKIERLILFLLLFTPLFSFAHGVSVGDQEILRNSGLWGYVQVGTTHMLTGYDHLLFLVGVLFYLNNLKDISKFITIFTISHCIILILGTYLQIKADEHLIDAVIAFSVFYKGFENLGGFKKIKLQSPNLILMVGVFGLIHGFGLSTRLQSFDMGNEQILVKILCFNLGVEFGQVLALIPIVFVINKLKKHQQYPAFYKAINWYLILAGIGLIIYQLINYFSI